VAEDDDTPRKPKPTVQGIGAAENPNPRKRTMQGIPVARPGDSEPPLPLPEEDGVRRERVTMDFSGPPLPLPDESGSFPALELEIDDDELSDNDVPLALDLTDLGTEEALDLVDKRSRESEPEVDLRSEMQERLQLDDFSGALQIAELLLGRNPKDAAAQKVADESRLRLEQLYASRLGGTHRIPRVTVPQSDVRWLGLDHRGGFLLSRIDGKASIEELLDVCGMPRSEALKTLVELQDVRAIEVD